MAFVQNVPFFSIMLCMVCAIASAMLGRRAAKAVSVGLAAALAAMSLWLCAWLYARDVSYVYWMGHFPAPWGNELRAGPVEALLALCFSVVVLLSLLGGLGKLGEQVDEHKQSLFLVMIDLVLAAMMAMLYTNDLFTGYVFIEIMTLAACALIMSRQNGRGLVSAMRYMMMSLLGSGLTLIAIAITYHLTGHLLMENIRQSFAQMYQSGQYRTPLTVVVGLFFVGLGIKSALYPFHTWLPDAYGYSTPAASAVLSSVVSKAYIILLVKIFARVIGLDIVRDTHALNLVFGFGAAAMLMGSLSAMRSHDLRRMIAFSSVAQIGYIYAALGLGTAAGMVAALYHLMVHAFAKSGLFIAASSLADASGDSKRFSDLRGAGFRAPAAGACFTVCALCLTGVPLLGGFVSKLYMSEAAIGSGGWRMWVLLGALAVSTLLNAMYFIKTVITLYRPPRGDYVQKPFVNAPLRRWALAGFIAVNALLGFAAQPILRVISRGLQLFS